MSAGFLPTLNAVATTLLVVGFFLIRGKRPRAHRATMLAAFLVSCAFLVSYLIHHAQVGSVPFRGSGALRPVYFAVLVPHVILAAAVPPLAILTLRNAWLGRLERHRKLARVTLPIWLYVSVSGVAIYWMLYRL